MSSVPFSVAFGLLLTASLLKNSRAVPVPTTPLPPLPARRYLEPFDKDPFKDYSVDYQDVSKRTLAQQLENAKKFSRPWGPPPPEFFENNFFNPTPYKDQDQRNLLETNNVQPNYFDGYFTDDEFPVEEEETNFIEPPYPGDSNYLVEPPQLTYVEPTLLSSYQPNIGYSNAYVGSDSSNKDENENDAELEKENLSDEDDDYDNGGNITPTLSPQPLLPMFPPNGLFPPKLPPLLPKQNFNSDYDLMEIENKSRQREFRSVKPPAKGNYTPPEPKTKTLKESKQTVVEEAIKPAEKVPVEKEVFSRTTTITKTTAWYLNENNDVVVKEDVSGRPAPLKGKYTKTSKTTTSGPIPWYLQTFEDVIFEEENEKSKTILDKITYLKGMTPTSITSFTTAPNPWSTEVHEEVVLEEVMTKKEGTNEAKTGSHPSPLEHLVDYLPRSQLISDEPISVDKNIVEELLEELFDEDEIIVEINLMPDLPTFTPQMMPTMKPYPQFGYPQMHPLPPPQAQATEKDNFDDIQDFNGLTQNQVTTPKPLTTPPSIDNTFTPHAQIAPLQGTEQQMYSQPNFNYAQTTQHPPLYNNNQQQSTGSPGNRNSGKWESSMNRQMGDDNQQDGSRLQARMEQDRRDKMNPQGKRQMYSQQQQQQQQQKGMNRQQQGRTSRDL